MKQFTFFILACCFWAPTFSTARCQQSQEGQQSQQLLVPEAFEHPGLLHSRDDLSLIKERIANGSKSWQRRWDQLSSSKFGSLLYQPNAHPKVVRGPYNQPDIGSSELITDAAAAYTHALQWSVTEDVAHAEKAIEILNAWSSTLKSVSGHDAQLLIGMVGVRFCNAAELIRYSDAKWAKQDQQQFATMLREIFYSEIEDFNPTANGNWDASMIQTMLAIGIYLDDRDIFDRAVEQFLHGESNGAIENYINDFGECQETGRDQTHTQMGLGFLSCACEMAWKQGVDLYAASDNRLAMGYEYTAKYNLGHDVKYEPFRSIDGRYHYKKLSSDSRGRFLPIYRRVVSHYQTRLGIEMPYSAAAVKETKSRRRSSSQMPWEDVIYGVSESKKKEMSDSQ